MKHVKSILACSLLTLCGACEKTAPASANPEPTGSAAERNSATVKAGRTSHLDEVADDSPCGDYLRRLCAVAGEDTQICFFSQAVVPVLSPEACSAGLSSFAYTENKLREAAASCGELAQKLCAEVGEDSDSCGMVRAQTPGMPAEQCRAMLEDFDNVLSDLRAEERQHHPLEPDLAKRIAESAALSEGPADATVTVVEFSDVQCPFCSRAAKAMETAKQRYGDRVRFVFRNFPLEMHAEADLAAQALLAAAEQGKGAEFRDALFAHQDALGRADLEGYASGLGLEMDAFRTALDERRFASAVQADLELGRQAAVRGTPTTFINGARVPDPTDPVVLDEHISEALERAAGSEG